MEAPVDVVVVGAGPGGASVAIEAARGGATVALLEASGAVGGNAARSTGYLAFADFAMQYEAGIEDTADDFVSDMKAEVARQSETYGIMFDAELASLYAQESSGAYDFLTELGIEFNRFIPRPRQHRTDRMVDCRDVTQFRACMAREVARLDVDVRFGTRAQRLVSTEGRISGVEAVDEDGRALDFEARRGVVLAAGGYQASPDIRLRYQPRHLAVTPYLGLSTACGDGHRMGQAVGGDLINMTMIPPLIVVASAFVERAIAVDASGQRFHDEAGPYAERVDALMARRGRRAHYIYDDRTARDCSGLIDQMPDAPATGDTLSGLAAQIGCDPAGLSAAVETWNTAVAEEGHVEFGRVVLPADRLGIEEAPFHAVPMRVGINFPAGGFRVTTAMQVVDVFAEPIEGLYAVGDCVGGVSPAIGLGGIKIASAVTLGRVAGQVLAGARAVVSEPSSADRDPMPPMSSDRGMVIDVIDPDEGSAAGPKRRQA